VILLNSSAGEVCGEVRPGSSMGMVSFVCGCSVGRERLLHARAMVRRFRVSGLVMWLFPCRGPLDITKPIRDRRFGQRTTRSAVVGTSAGRREIGSFPYFRERCESLKPYLAEMIVSSAPMNVGGEAQVKAASGEDYDRSAM
jgi:hypothetical protein